MIKASTILHRVTQLAQAHPLEKRVCQYFYDDGTPCCIVGEALVEAGIRPEIFLADEDLNLYTNVEELFHVHADELGLENDLDYHDFNSLYWIQKRQDKGDAWGEAVRWP